MTLYSVSAEHFGVCVTVLGGAAARCEVDAGADFGVTQLFYDCEKYGTFLKRCKEMGIPDSFKVYPGIMPIQNYAGFKRMTGFCKTFIPKHITEALEPIQHDQRPQATRHELKWRREKCRLRR